MNNLIFQPKAIMFLKIPFLVFFKITHSKESTLIDLIYSYNVNYYV